MHPFYAPLTRMRQMAENVAKRRDVAEEAVNKTGILRAFKAEAIIAEELTADEANITDLDSTNASVSGKLTGVQFASATVLNAGFRDLSHGLNAIPFWVVVQSSVDEIVWNPVVSDVGGWIVAIDNAKVRVTNGTGFNRFVRGMIIG